MESQVSSTETRERNCVPAKELAEIGARIFAGAGSSANEAALIADHLVEANLVGHDSHGVIRIKKYVDWAKAGQVLPNRHVVVVADRGAALLLDGGFGYGQVIGREAMALAAERAGTLGFAIVPSAIQGISAASAPGPSSSPRPATFRSISSTRPASASWWRRMAAAIAVSRPTRLPPARP